MITDDIFNTCRFVETSHGHGPNMWVYTYGCKEHPRLQVKDLGDRKRKICTRSYLVDGRDLGSGTAGQAAAIAALNVPVVVTPEEQAVLDTLPADWTDCEPGTRGDMVERTFSLRCKGLIEWERGRYRRAPAP